MRYKRYNNPYIKPNFVKRTGKYTYPARVDGNGGTPIYPYMFGDVPDDRIVTQEDLNLLLSEGLDQVERVKRLNTRPKLDETLAILEPRYKGSPEIVQRWRELIKGLDDLTIKKKLQEKIKFDPKATEYEIEKLKEFIPIVERHLPETRPKKKRFAFLPILLVGGGLAAGVFAFIFIGGKKKR